MTWTYARMRMFDRSAMEPHPDGTALIAGDASLSRQCSPSAECWNITFRLLVPAASVMNAMMPSSSACPRTASRSVLVYQVLPVPFTMSSKTCLLKSNMDVKPSFQGTFRAWVLGHAWQPRFGR
jgi:hypothetical protein